MTALWPRQIAARNGSRVHRINKHSSCEKNGPAAAAEFQKFLEHPGIVQNFLFASLAHLQIGRAYAISGDAAKAACQNFFTLWKNADADVPILNEAKAEYAKLH